MAAPVHQRRPTFLWQAALILLPVIVLAFMGWYSLRQDKILAEHDAKERAQAIADDLLPKVWNELTPRKNLKEQLAVEIDQAGHLLFPPPIPPVPTPKSFNLAELNPEQTRLWAVLQNGEAVSSNPDSLIEAWEKFIAAEPPENLAAAGGYDLGVLLERQKKYASAAEVFGAVVNQYPGAVGETGLPLQPLAQLKLIELGGRAPSEIAWTNVVSMDSFFSNIVCHPTLLTPELFNRVEQLEQQRLLTYTGAWIKWHQTWQDHEVLRVWYASVSPRLDTNPQTEPARFVWFQRPERDSYPAHFFGANWDVGPAYWLLALRLPDIETDQAKTNFWLAFRDESNLGNWLSSRLENEWRIPDYFGIGVEVAGKRIAAFAPDLRVWHYVSWANPHSEGGGLKKEYSTNIASVVMAAAVKTENGAETMKVNVYLTGPDALYQRQRARAFWFGALIVVSTAAALIGLTMAWRAFRRQLQLSEMKSNFVSSVSHELRAPIASVRLMAENLARGKIQEPQKQREYFAFIVQECRRLTSLIENVLDFSRIEQGRKQYEFEPTDMVALVKQTVALMEPNATEKGVKLETFNIQHSTPNLELSVDGRAIQQALVNLIDNAIKHSPKGEAVTVGLEVRSAECGMRSDGTNVEATAINYQLPTLNLSVTDHGPGIPPDEQEKIFERFYRRGSELRRETQGVGIGLSIVKHIVEAHGGHARVESNVGQGSRFTIALPITNETTNNER